MKFIDKLKAILPKKAKRSFTESPTASHLPEKGEVDATGREVLLSLRNVDITFGKGDRAVRAVKNASFDIYKGETFSLVGAILYIRRLFYLIEVIL